MRGIAQKATLLLLTLTLSLGLLSAPAAAAAPADQIEDPLLWLAGQLTEKGSIIYDYFSSRKGGSSLDSTGYNHAPDVNAKLEAAGYTVFSYRIYKISNDSFQLCWSDEAIDPTAVSTQVVCAEMYDTATGTRSPGHVGTSTKGDGEGHTIYILNTATFEAHTPGEWVPTKEATALEAGEEVQHCTICEALLGTRIIEKLPTEDLPDENIPLAPPDENIPQTSPDEPVLEDLPDEALPLAVPNTGDQRTAVLLLLVGAGSLAVAGAVIFFRRRAR